MPLPKFQPPAFEDRQSAGAEADHYFDMVHGDVAALQARIERGFSDYHFERAPQSPFGERLETTIQMVSRAAGVFGLVGTLGLIAYALI